MMMGRILDEALVGVTLIFLIFESWIWLHIWGNKQYIEVIGTTSTIQSFE
jgi:S-adenosylmethionine/arginine decarboxylase-like enzyme